MHLITLQAKANAQQRDTLIHTHTHSLTHTGVLLGASIDMRTSKERQTEKGFTQDTIFNYTNRENYGGGITELCKSPLKSTEATLYDSH